MGRTVPSFRIALEMEEREWNKPFRNALDKSDRKKFDDEMMFDICRSYISACSYAIQPARLYPILMSILPYCYKQLTEYIQQVEQIEAKVEGLLLQQKIVQEDLQPPRQLKLSEF
jgi:hypothetical protein